MNDEAKHGETLLLTESLLANSGYVRLRQPLALGATDFDFQSVFSGQHGSLDLIVVQVARDHGELAGAQWELQRLARALDSAVSRRNLTIVIVGDVSQAFRSISEMQEVARVLRVASHGSREEVAEWISPLMPLHIGARGRQRQEPLSLVEDSLEGRADVASLRRLTRAARISERNVRETLGRWLETSFEESDR